MTADRAPAEAGGELGAYGLRLANVLRARRLLVAAPGHWPRLEIRTRLARPSGGAEWVTDDAALLRLQSGGEIELDRAAERATFVLPRRVGTSELVHPLLAPVGSVMAHWLDRDSFHAAAFVVDGHAWALVGTRGVGKSTMVAALARRGVHVVCDDLLVIEDRRALTGPRSVDLRAEAAERLGVGEPLGVVGMRERWRLPLPPAGPEHPFAGWVFLVWGETLAATRVTAAERLVRIHGNRAVTLPPKDPGRLLDLASLPAWELSRPVGWETLDDSIDRLLAAVGGR